MWMEVELCSVPSLDVTFYLAPVLKRGNSIITMHHPWMGQCSYNREDTGLETRGHKFKMSLSPTS